MTQYLISFGAHAMDHAPDEDAPAVARAAHAAVQESVNAGVHVSAGGLEDQPASIAAPGGAVTGGTGSGASVRPNHTSARASTTRPTAPAAGSRSTGSTPTTC